MENRHHLHLVDPSRIHFSNALVEVVPDSFVDAWCCEVYLMKSGFGGCGIPEGVNLLFALLLSFAVDFGPEIARP